MLCVTFEVTHLLTASCCSTSTRVCTSFPPFTRLSSSACQFCHEASTMPWPDTTRVHSSFQDATSSFFSVAPSAVQFADSIGSDKGWDYPLYDHFSKQISPFYSSQDEDEGKMPWDWTLGMTDFVPAEQKTGYYDVEHVFELQQLNLFMIKAEAARHQERNNWAQWSDGYHGPWSIFFRDADGPDGAVRHPMSSIVAKPKLESRDQVTPRKWSVRLILAQ